MSLFGDNQHKKKKGSGLRTLSEREIQDKLYGAYRAPLGSAGQSTEVKSKPGAAVSIEEPSKKTAADLFKSPSFQPAAGASKNDLFIKSPANPDLVRELKKETKAGDYRSGVSEWADEDNSAAAKARHESWREQRKVNRGEGVLQKQMGKALAQTAKTLAGGIAGFFAILFGGIAALAGSMDLKDAKTRQILYWICGLGFLLMALAGINLLNVTREAAMKMPHKKAVQPVETREAPVSVAQPQESPTAKSSAKSAANDGLYSGPLSKAVSDKPPKATIEKKQTAKPPPQAEARPASEEPKNEDAVRQGYAIQVATYALQADADSLAGQFRRRQFPSFVKGLNRPAGRIYYCVFIGPFQDYAEAEKEIDFFKKKEFSRPFQDAFIRSL